MTDFRKIDLLVLLDKLNIVYEVNHDSEIKAICPLPDHKDTKPSWFMCAKSDSQLYGRWHCFGCHQKGDPVTLVSKIKGWNRNTAMIFLQKEFGLGKGGGLYSNSITDYFSNAKIKNDEILNFESFFTHMQLLKGIENEFSRYLESRNVTAEEIESYEVYFARVGYFENRVIFPVYTEGELRTLWSRDITGKARSKILYPKAYKETTSRALFNYDVAKAFKTVWVVEGVFDALKMRRFGYSNVVAVLSSNCSDYQAGLLSEFQKVIVVPDGDDAGHGLLESIVSLLKFQTQLAYVPLDSGEDPDSSTNLKEKLLKPMNVFERSTKFKLGIKYDTRR